MEGPATWLSVSIIIWDATSTKTTALLLFPAILPPAPASPRPAQSVAASLLHCSELLSEANSCRRSCMPCSVSGCLGALVALTAC